MPTIEENRAWDDPERWDRGGDDWSDGYGGPDAQWYGSIIPRIHRLVPAATVVEIGCGHGRWSGYLRDLSEHLTLVDLNPSCVEACRARFGDADDVDYLTNDGRSLVPVASGSVDLVFSYDSLVHADVTAVVGYLSELRRVLAPDGVAFLHHSNLGAFANEVRLAGIPRVGGALRRLGLVEPRHHWRDPGVSAEVVRVVAEADGLVCTSQELVPWGGSRRPIDCISVLTRATSRRARPTRTWENPGFTDEAAQVARMADVYGI